MNLRAMMPFGGRSVAARRDGDDPFLSLHREIDRLFDDAFRGFGAGSAQPALRDWAPRVDLKETESEIQVTAELPGVDEKDVEVTLADDVLTIKGEKKSEKEEQKKDYYLMERSYGAFYRALPMPAGIDASKVKADFSKGVLSVTLPKTAETKAAARKIEIRKS
jgi:HSP20 family protein